MTSDEPSALIAGRYRLDERIGLGGMGIVWRATDLELGRVVALKQSQLGDNGQIRREARIGAGLHHPHVVTVFDAVLEGDERWLVMEYLQSRSLSAILAEDGPLSPVDVARIGAQLASALVAMHERGIVHRDVKPGNVLLTEDGVAKLTDLGIARWAEVTLTASDQAVVGTPGFLAPEVADGHEAGRAADVYSLGATLFAAVEGISPTGSGEQGPYVQLRRAATGRLEPLTKAGPLAPVLTALLAKESSERPSARMAKGLLDDIAGDPVRFTPLPKPRAARRRFAGIAGAAAIALVAAGAVYFFSDATPPAAADGVGDPHTANPCALLNPAAASQFGILVTLNTEYGPFSRCGLLIKLSQDPTDLVDAWLEMQGPPEYPTQPFTPGQLGPVERFVERDGECPRSVRLPDGNQIMITSRHQKGRPAPLCAISEALTNDAYAVLSHGSIPRRTEPFPADSLGRVDACAMLTEADVVKALGEAEINATIGMAKVKPEPEFGNWQCYWGTDPLEVDVEFARDYPLTPGSEHGEAGEQIRIGDRDAFMEVRKSGDDEHDTCVVQVVQRRYEKDAAWNKDWVETADVTVETEEDAPPQKLCDKALGLAKVMVERLPR